ncbi:MAG: hypothetical protein HFE72_08525 [Emergencia sp.]|nr:hypothetical protein [Emergencia sp.]
MNINYLNKKMERKNMIMRMAVVFIAAALLILCMTAPAFAASGELQTGKNFGEWALDQIWYIALAVCAFMIVRFLIKKAWVQMVLFIVLGALCLFLIASPESLKGIGEKLFNMI